MLREKQENPFRFRGILENEVEKLSFNAVPPVNILDFERKLKENIVNSHINNHADILKSRQKLKEIRTHFESSIRRHTPTKKGRIALEMAAKRLLHRSGAKAGEQALEEFLLKADYGTLDLSLFPIVKGPEEKHLEDAFSAYREMIEQKSANSSKWWERYLGSMEKHTALVEEKRKEAEDHIAEFGWLVHEHALKALKRNGLEIEGIEPESAPPNLPKLLRSAMMESSIGQRQFLDIYRFVSGYSEGSLSLKALAEKTGKPSYHLKPFMDALVQRGIQLHHITGKGIDIRLPESEALERIGNIPVMKRSHPSFRRLLGYFSTHSPREDIRLGEEDTPSYEDYREFEGALSSGGLSVADVMGRKIDVSPSIAELLKSLNEISEAAENKGTISRVVAYLASRERGTIPQEEEITAATGVERGDLRGLASALAKRGIGLPDIVAKKELRQWASGRESRLRLILNILKDKENLTAQHLELAIGTARSMGVDVP